ncbi:MAG TPA: restriction endonuclease subunit S [Sphingobacterium sp.]|nr:restriction endonuclease subunit S [Sphingobacterium sp.]
MTNLVRDGIYLDLSDLKFVQLPKDSNEGKRTSLKFGDILISITAELGKLGWIPEGLGTAYINQHTALVRMKDSVDSKFVAYSLSTEKYNNKLNSLNDSGAKAGLNLGTIRNFELIVPPKEEQTKIASFLSAMDEKISQLTQKHELLNQYKQGMMQKLFSQEIRFKADDGSEFGEWENISVKEIFDVTRGQVLAVSNTVSVADADYKYPVFSSQTKQKGLMGFYKKYLFEDALTWTTDGANAGDVNFRKGKFYCTNVCGVLLSKKGYANLCIAEILNKVTHKYVSYVGNPKLMNNVMSEIPITIPINLEEQTKIANFLSAIDQKIEVVAEQIEQAKQWKKGLLQQMFV